MIELDFDKGRGLLPVIAQDWKTREVLMLAYINHEAWRHTLATGNAVYFSRSRNTLWKKGEVSGNVQKIHDILIDCDRDTVIYLVEQIGDAACHTGYRSCFYTSVGADGSEEKIISEKIFDPEKVYPAKGEKK